MEHDHGGGGAGSPEQDAALARDALAAGDLPHSIFHIGCALAADPARGDWIDLLDRVIASARDRGTDPLAIAPLSPESEFAAVAVHAHILATTGRVADAIGLLLEVCAVSHAPYAPWAQRWLAGADPGAIETAAIRRGLLQLVRAHPGDRLDDRARAELEPVVALIEPLLDAHPTDAMFQYVGSMILRKARHLSRAIATAERAHQLAPSWATAVGLAYARRESGDLSGASAAFSAAEAVDPTDQTARADHAQMLCTGGEVARGLALYESILSVEPGNHCAIGAYCTYRAQAHPDEDEALWRRLLDHVERHPRDTESAWWLDRMAERAPYVRCLPRPTEATLNMAIGMWSRARNGEQPDEILSIATTALEAPSSILAMAATLRDIGLDRIPTISASEIPSPDPRLPRRDDIEPMWRYEGTIAAPAVAPPSAEVAAAVARLAAERYHGPAWWNGGEALARVAGDAASLRGAMLHPASTPGGTPPWDHIYRCQVAAAFGLARLDDGWAGSRRRDALLALALGQVDWTVDAAVIALAELALHVPDALAEVIDLYTELMTHPPRPGHCSYERPLIYSFSRLPLPDPLKATVEEWRHRIDE